jgi:hypothetical protein
MMMALRARQHHPDRVVLRAGDPDQTRFTAVSGHTSGTRQARTSAGLHWLPGGCQPVMRAPARHGGGRGLRHGWPGPPGRAGDGPRERADGRLPGNARVRGGADGGEVRDDDHGAVVLGAHLGEHRPGGLMAGGQAARAGVGGEHHAARGPGRLALPRREGSGRDGLPRSEHAGLLAARAGTLITGELAGRGVRVGLRDRYRADG